MFCALINRKGTENDHIGVSTLTEFPKKAAKVTDTLVRNGFETTCYAIQNGLILLIRLPDNSLSRSRKGQ